MSKWIPSSSLMVRSCKSCIHAANFSSPSIARAGSVSSNSLASLIPWPGVILSAAVAISNSTQASCSQPHWYVSSRSNSMPLYTRAASE